MMKPSKKFATKIHIQLVRCACVLRVESVSLSNDTYGRRTEMWSIVANIVFRLFRLPWSLIKFAFNKLKEVTTSIQMANSYFPASKSRLCRRHTHILKKSTLWLATDVQCAVVCCAFVNVKREKTIAADIISLLLLHFFSSTLHLCCVGRCFFSELRFEFT